MKLLAQITLGIFGSFLLSGCVSPRTIASAETSPPPLPGMVKGSVVKQSFTTAARVAPGTIPLTVAFNIPTNGSPATGFRLYGGHALNRSNWVLLAESTTNRITFASESPGYGLLGVKAFNEAGESDWGTCR